MKRAWRLKSEADVQLVWQQGGTWAHPLVILRARPNGLAQSRVAFVVSKKVGKAVARNRVKRLMREALRQQFERITPGYDIVVIGRGAVIHSGLSDISAAIQQVLQRAKLMQADKAGGPGS